MFWNWIVKNGIKFFLPQELNNNQLQKGGSIGMNKKVLEDYVHIKMEIKDLKRRIAEDKEKLIDLEQMIVVDTVSCGKKGRKTLKTVQITGKPTAEIQRRKLIIEHRVARLQELETELEQMTNEVETFIEQIEKSELRIMFRLYYIDGLTWVQVAHKMNDMFPKSRYGYTEDNCWQRNKRFLKSIGA